MKFIPLGLLQYTLVYPLMRLKILSVIKLQKAYLIKGTVPLLAMLTKDILKFIRYYMKKVILIKEVALTLLQ